MTTSIQALEVATSQPVLMEAHVDVTGAFHVDVSWNKDKTTMWVNVNGVCLLRICKIENLSVSGKKVL